MMLKRLTVFAVIFGAVILLLSPVILTNLINSRLTAEETEAPNFSDKETETIVKEAQTFGQILYFYATMALEKPLDLRLCAYEMFRLKPNENSCRDKYSAWHSKEEMQLLETEIEGNFGGVGLEVSDRDGKVVVVSPIDGTPAFRAGFKPEDVIVKIDGKPVLNIIDAITRLRGKVGTSVKITIERSGREFTFEIVREIITIHAVSAKIIDSPQGAIGYIKVKTFSEIMPEEFRKEITGLRGKGVAKFILDFRNNPGGLLNSAIDILYDFARSSDTFMVMRERIKSKVFDTPFIKREFNISRGPGAFRDTKIVILINKGSASASEIFAGAMKDWGFPVIGSRSFGKGVGQQIFPLANGSALRLTTFEFLVGNSKIRINDIGVIPTFEISDLLSSPAEILRKDRQLEKAIEIFSR